MLLALIFIATKAMGERVTQEQAMQKAQLFLLSSQKGNKQNKPLKLAQRKAPHIEETTATYESAYYAFNIGQDEGFVLVSSNDQTPAILGYAEQGAFDGEDLPAHIQAWLDGYADQMAYLERTNTQQALRLSVKRNAISPLLTTTWYQDAPYNNMCPIDPSTNKRSATGCVATAMAQVINYHKKPLKTTSTIPAYTTETHGIQMPAIEVTTIDWNNMLDDYSGSTTTAQRKAVATLMLLCGQAVEMDYASDASSSQAGAIAYGLKTFFGYDKTTTALDRNAFSATAWENLIYNDLANGRPIVYAGKSTGGGHAFVIDGYDGNGLYHVNWGWGGNYDGYFVLSVLNPNGNDHIGASGSVDGYSFSQCAILLSSIGETDESIADCMTIYNMTVEGKTTFERSSSAEDFTGIAITPSVYNMTGGDHSFYISLQLFDEEGNGKKNLGYQAFNVNYLYGGQCEFSDLDFGKDLADGDYYIYAASWSDNSENWNLCWGYEQYGVKATIEGNTLTLTPPTISMHATITATGKTEMATTLPLQAKITNDGTYYNNDIFLIVDGKTMGGRIFEADEGETASFDIDYIPTKNGSNKIELAYLSPDDMKTFVTFATTTIQVQPAASDYHLNYSINVLNTSNTEVKTDYVHARVTVSNDGADYSQAVMLRLFKLIGEDWTYMENAQQKLTLASGASSTIDFEFSQLENNQQYLLSFMYINAASWVDEGGYVTFTTNIQAAPKLKGELELMNANAEGNLDETSAKIKATISNSGTASTGRIPIVVILYQQDKTSGQYQYKTDTGYYKTIDMGKSESFEVSFNDLEPGTNYRAIISYGADNGNGGYDWIDDINSSMEFSVIEEAVNNTCHLAFDVKFNGMNDQNAINSTMLQAEITFTNDGANDYDNIVQLSLYDSTGTQQLKNVTKHLTLAVGETKTLSFTIDGLDDKQEYVVAIWYFSNPVTNEVTYNDTVYRFLVDVSTTSSIDNTTTYVTPQDAYIYDLKGRKVTLHKSVKRQIVIKNGKKIVK